MWCLYYLVTTTCCWQKNQLCGAAILVGRDSARSIFFVFLSSFFEKQASDDIQKFEITN